MKKNRTFILLFVNCMTSLFVAFAATIAWFVTAKQNNAYGMQITPTVPEITLNYTIYKHDVETDEVIATDDANELYLKSYDTIITEKNHDMALVVKFEISGQKLAQATESFIWKVLCSETNYNTDYISNITTYNIAPLDISATTNEGIYNEVLDELPNTDVTFVNSTSKTTTIQKSIPVSSYGSYITDDNMLNLYMKIDYDTNLIAANFSDVEVSTEQAGGTILFENDITAIEIS